MYKKPFIQVICLSVISCLSIATPVQAAKNDHPHFRLIPNDQLEKIRVSSETQVPLSDPNKQPLSNELHYDEKNPTDAAILVGTASINLSKLVPAKVKAMDATQADLVLPDPQISIGQNNYTLSILESVFDHKQHVRYVTAKIVSHEGYARFIIDDSTGELVGHLEVDGNIYRILPRELSKHQQLIYKLERNKPGAKEPKATAVSKPTSESINRLEKELLKTEAIHGISPRYYLETLRREGRRVSLVGGDIGQVNVKKVLKRDVTAVSELLNRLAVVTGSKDTFEYVVNKIAGDSKRGYSVHFRQVINGIAVANGSKIKFDPQGKVRSLSTLVIDPELTEIKTSIFEETQILDMAVAAVRDHLNNTDLAFVTIEQTPTTLQYKIVDNDYTLVPRWHVVLYSVEPGLGPFNVFIDGNTGKAKVRKAAIHLTTQFQTDVCEHESGVSLPLCQDVVITYPVYLVSTVREVISESPTGQFVCELAGLCQDPQAKHPWEVINNMEDWLSESTDGFCCDGVGGLSGAVDVKVNTQEADGPSFNSGTNTISFPHPASLEPSVFNSVQSQKIDDAVVHEAAHAVIHGSNPELSQSIKNDDPWAEALDEGLSDAMAILYSEKFNPPGDTLVAEELFKDPSYIRDISENKTFDDFVDSSGKAHENGKIFSNFIYKARQQGLTIDQAAKVIVWMAEEIVPDGGLISGKTDEKDIRDVLDNISASDQTIGNILNAVWEEMNGYEEPPAGGGGSGGSGAPSAPSFIAGIFTGCYGNISLYSNTWEAPSGASYYHIYYSLDGVFFTYSFSSIPASAATYNTANVYVKVAACNSNGCSPPSSISFYQAHLCGG